MGNNIGCISQTTAASFAGAAGNAVVTFPSTTAGFNNGDICMTYCSTEYSGSLLLYGPPPAVSASGVECYCFPDELSPSDLVESQNFDGTCRRGTVKVIKKTTTFRTLQCVTVSAAPGAGPVSTVPNIPACFVQCSGSSQANIMYAADASAFQCYCGVNAVSTFANCRSGSSTYTFTHQNYPASSGMARRAAQDRRAATRRARLGKGGDMEYCPVGLSACQIAAKSSSGYECIDTLTELDSCGGCTFGLYTGPGKRSVKSISVDCTTIPGTPLGGVTCIDGECIAMACDEGFALYKGTCVPLN